MGRKGVRAMWYKGKVDCFLKHPYLRMKKGQTIRLNDVPVGRVK